MSASGSPKRVAFFGDYVLRLCGIATFTRDLCGAVNGTGRVDECYAGALIHDNQLILPCAMSDKATAIASIPLPTFLAALGVPGK